MLQPKSYRSNLGHVYKFSAYCFKGGVLTWIYDSTYEYDPEHKLIDRSLDELSHRGVKPTLLVIERPDDIVAFHYSHGKWRLKSLD